MAKPMYALSRTIVPEAIKKMWGRFECWKWGHIWKLNRGDPVCSRCGAYKRDDKRAKSKRAQARRRWRR